jgi:hypothetical protein
MYRKAINAANQELNMLPPITLFPFGFKQGKARKKMPSREEFPKSIAARLWHASWF